MEKVEEVKENVEGGKTGGNFNVQNDAKFSLKSFFHTWTLENFSKCLNFADASVYSPVFEFDNASWRFLLHVVSEDQQLKEIKIRPCKVNKDGINHYLRYNISICDDLKAPLATKAAESRLENENFGHRLTFKFDGDEKEALKYVLENDKLIFHCELLILSAIPCEQESAKQASAQELGKKNATQWLLFTSKKALPGNSPRLVSDWVRDTEKFLFCIMLCLAVPMIMMISIQAETQKNKEAKLINELIIDTTLKVYDIAEAFNFTEIKSKSLELLSSYHNLYDVRDSSKINAEKYFSVLSSKLEKDTPA